MNFPPVFQHSTFDIQHSRSLRRAFTVLELTVFMAIFVVISIAFITILVSVLRVQARQSSVAEVSQQSQYLMQTIQYYVERSSVIEMEDGTATATIKLRMTSSTEDPTLIYVSGGIAYLQQAGGTAQQLSSNKVRVTTASFIKRPNPPGHDSLDTSFTVTYNTAAQQFLFSQVIDMAVTRVNAATFDSNVIPSTGNTYKVGSSGAPWQSVNDTIYFSGSNVGIGTASPAQTLEVNGGVRLNTATAQPTCNSAGRGTFWVVQSGTGVKDYVQVCVKNASDAYVWALIY